MANITKKAAYWTKIGDDNAKIHFETQADQVIVSPGVDGETNLQELLETIGSNETAIDGRLGDLESRATGVETRAANLEKREIAGNGPIGVVKSTTAGVIKHTISIDSAEEDTLGVVYITDGWNSSTGGPSSTAVSVTALGAYDEDVMGGHKIAKASADTLGHVKVGGNININADGVINANTATDTVAGVVKAGTNTTIVNGAVNVASGSTTTTGVLQLSNSLNSSTTTAITPSAVQFEISKLSKLFNPVGSVSIELTDEQRDNPGTISADITAALKAKHNNDSYVPAKGDAATVKVTGTEPSDAPYDKLGDLTGKTWIFIYGMDWEFGEIWTPEIQLQSDLTGAALLSGNNTFAGTNEFSNPLVVGAPEDNDHAATKLYVDEQITAGTPDASTTTKGITYISNDSGNAVNGTNSNTAITVAGATAKFLGIGSTAVSATTAGNANKLNNQLASYYLNASHINDGTLLVSRGGTGSGDPEQGRINLGAAKLTVEDVAPTTLAVGEIYIQYE